MAHASISAARLINAMLVLRPDAAPKLALLAEALCNEEITDPHTFGDIVRRELGNTIMLDAILLIHGAPVTRSTSDGDVGLRLRLVRHSMQCCGSRTAGREESPASAAADRRPSCSIPGCAEIRSMFGTLKEHAAACAKPPGACATCAQLRKIAQNLAAAPPRTAAAATCARPVASKLQQPASARRIVTAQLKAAPTTTLKRKAARSPVVVATPVAAPAPAPTAGAGAGASPASEAPDATPRLLLPTRSNSTLVAAEALGALTHVSVPAKRPASALVAAAALARTDIAAATEAAATEAAATEAADADAAADAADAADADADAAAAADADSRSDTTASDIENRGDGQGGGESGGDCKAPTREAERRDDEADATDDRPALDLMMLARSALGELASPTRSAASPRNSPARASSPDLMRRLIKRPRLDAKTKEGAWQLDAPADEMRKAPPMRRRRGVVAAHRAVVAAAAPSLQLIRVVSTSCR